MSFFPNLHLFGDSSQTPDSGSPDSSEDLATPVSGNSARTAEASPTPSVTVTDPTAEFTSATNPPANPAPTAPDSSASTDPEPVAAPTAPEPVAASTAPASTPTSSTAPRSEPAPSSASAPAPTNPTTPSTAPHSEPALSAAPQATAPAPSASETAPAAPTADTVPTDSASPTLEARLEKLEQLFSQREEQLLRLERDSRLRSHYGSLERQALELKKEMPDFDLSRELEDPEFLRLTSPEVGLPVESAYFALHHKELMSGLAGRTAAALSETIRSGAERPGENGTVSREPVSTQPRYYSQMTPAERQIQKKLILNGLKF